LAFRANERNKTKDRWKKHTAIAVIATSWINSTKWPRTLVPTVEQMASQMVRHGIARLRSVSDVANTRIKSHT
jgi:hypothetical protein